MSDISLEELLKTIEKAEAEESEEKKPVHKEVTHMDRFISENNIRVGTDRVPNYVIYHLYRIVWQGVPRKYKQNKIKFFRTFNKRFTQARVGKERRYLLDGSSFDLTREGKLKAEHYDKKYQKWTKEKREKERQRKVSKSKEKSKHKS